jgi:hypothetical protein
MGGLFSTELGKKLKLFCIFWRWTRRGDWAEKKQMCFVCGLAFSLYFNLFFPNNLFHFGRVSV